MLVGSFAKTLYLCRRAELKAIMLRVPPRIRFLVALSSVSTNFNYTTKYFTVQQRHEFEKAVDEHVRISYAFKYSHTRVIHAFGTSSFTF